MAEEQEFNLDGREQINRTLLGSTKLEQQLKVSQALKESVISHFDHSMYSIMNSAQWMQLYVFQFTAVFLFTFAFCSSMVNFEVDTQAAGAILMAICLTTPFCGANLNPMVTISNCLSRENKYKWKKVLGVYLAAQFLGTFGGLLWGQVMGLKMQPQMLLNDQSDAGQVILNQGMGVFIFIFFMLMLSNPNTTFIQNELTGYMSITIFYFIARSFAPFAASTLNPAFTISLGFHYGTKGNWTTLSNCWAWLIGDIIGCLCATYFYQLLYEPIVRELREIRRREESFQTESESGLSNKNI